MTRIHLLSRKRVAQLLDLPSSQKTYELFPADTWGNDIPERELVSWLNERRGGGMPELAMTMLPQLVSDRRLAREGAVLRDGKPASVRKLRSICKRALFPCPHFQLSERRFAFTPDAVEWWASQIRSGTYVNQRRYQLPA